MSLQLRNELTLRSTFASYLEVGGDEAVVAPADNNDEPVSVPLAVARFLQAAVQFRRRDEHIANAQAMLGMDQNQAHELIATLIDSNLLRSSADFARSLRGETEPPPHPPISVIGIPTKGRPELLTRCVSQHMVSCRTHGRHATFLIADGADTQSDAQLEQLRRLEHEFALPIEYAGPNEKRRFVTLLADKGVARPDVLEFGIIGDRRYLSTGANRNCLNLGSLGKLLLCCDDDVVPRVGRLPGCDTTSLRFSSKGTCAIVPYTSQDAAVDAATWTERDLLAVHEQALGHDVRHLQRLLGCDPETVEFDELPTQDMFSLFHRTQKVVATWTGFTGDAGGSVVPCAYGLYNQPLSLPHSDAAFQLLLAERKAARWSRYPQVGNFLFWMGAGACGYDNRDLLPPYQPVLRCQDNRYGQLMQYCNPHGLRMMLPEVVEHAAPLRPSPDSGSYWRQGYRFTEYLGLLIKQFPILETLQPADRLRALGRHLVSVRDYDSQEFETLLRQPFFNYHSHRMTGLRRSLDAHPEAPQAWKDYAEATIERSLARLNDGALMAVSDLEDRPITDAIVRDLIVRFGDVLMAWPDIVRETRELANAGITLPRPVHKQADP